jgi:hypothetical protein
MILLFICINLVISFLNAYGVGRTWKETKFVGGTAHFMNCMAGTMAAVGFSWCWLVVVAFLAGPDGLNKLPVKYVQGMFDLGYLAIIVPCVGSGTAITINTWAHFWRNRTVGNGALVVYNTGADLYNIYGAVQYAPSAWEHVLDMFKGSGSSSSSSSDDDDSSGALAAVAVGLCAFALAAGVITTVLIVRTVASRRAADMLSRA